MESGGSGPEKNDPPGRVNDCSTQLLRSEAAPSSLRERNPPRLRREQRSLYCGPSGDSSGPSSPVRTEDVDRTLQQQDSGVESALLYAKAWSKYTKELLAWVEKRLSIGEIRQDGQMFGETESNTSIVYVHV